ncbi:hypothetical protein VNO78_00711 [Psophocarpus tetragonolobus]|uniref:Uncharacterized protein n=1 Tax=Psophocarpus tetragonolobus TaxID=3891 RepID=A0AAN9XUB4_PSOTE
MLLSLLGIDLASCLTLGRNKNRLNMSFHWYEYTLSFCVRVSFLNAWNWSPIPTYQSSKDLHGPNVAVYKETLNQLRVLGGRGGCIVQGAILKPI